MSGQIASNMQSAHQRSLGTSMKVAKIRLLDDDEAPLVPHVVVGTTGGFVYAIDPMQAPPANGDFDGERPAVLRHVSPNLGSYAVGLDTGNLDDDADDEIVCGNWVDQGTFVDWQAGTASKNRANLYVLDPTPGGSSTTLLTETILNGDDLMGAGFGIGSGVTGVKIDDVDNDGDKEIWCGDAAGYIYLFAKDAAGGWHCVDRSGSFATYPGFYNNLHPIKTAAGKTTKLLVQSPGYTMLFSVDFNEVAELP